ncbi:SRPBCC family protein [Flavobacterium sp. 3HN19-14]|uniref:SRPBCC family protein n=1 Tax=Flavobacterium sp. 3HN19-14 TaxID=3448133 RepID=UPI003EDFE133
MDNQPVKIERTFDAPISKVWHALTDNEQLKQWYFQLPEFKPEIGFEFSFLAGSDDKKWMHICKVTQLIPVKKIAYTWRYEGQPGNSEISFELFDEGEKTRLLLIHTGLESFADAGSGFSEKQLHNGVDLFYG